MSEEHRHRFDSAPFVEHRRDAGGRSDVWVRACRCGETRAMTRFPTEKELALPEEDRVSVEQGTCAECGGALQFDEGYFCENAGGCRRVYEERIASLESQVSRMQAVVDAARWVVRWADQGGWMVQTATLSKLRDALSSIDTGEEGPA